MKKMRRIASLLLALAMAFGLTATAFAAETTDRVDVGVDVDDQIPEGHTYTAYQILKGTLSEREGKEYLVDSEWGDGVNWAKNPADNVFLQALKGDDRFIVNGANIFAAAEDAEGVAKALNEVDDNDALAKAFANVANAHKAGSGTAIEGESVSLSPGYYLVVDSTGSLGGNDAYNPALLQVTKSGGITIEKKYSVPTVDKSVTGTDNVTGEAADCNIGDSVTFTLTGTLPEKGLDDYEKYEYRFEDELSSGLWYNGNAEVYLYKNGNVEDATEANKIDITTEFTISPDGKPSAAGGKLTISIADLKPVLTKHSGTPQSKIVVEYTAELTKGAVVGGDGNPNTVKLVYSNNPNQGGEGSTGETPEDKVVVFTYGLEGSKVDGNGNTPLADAEFILYRVKEGGNLSYDDKNIPHGVEYAQVDADGELTGWGKDLTEDAARQAAINAPLRSNDKGEFSVKGLDAGTYYLEETKAPAGYNMLKGPVKLVITADTGKDKSEVIAETEAPVLTNLKLEAFDKDDNKLSENPGVLEKGTVLLVVENSAGALLPSTGGMGTTLFYIAGAALVLAADILLVLKRRTNTGK